MAAVLTLLQQVAVVATLLAGLAVALALDDTGVGQRLRRRFVMGVPWGTLVATGFVVAVYLFVQSGLDHWYNPVVIPFRAWSYLYPLGVLTAAFTHVGPGHLLGNVFGALALSPIVEYAWGHFPRERGARSFGSLRENPLARAFVVYPLAVVAVGLLLAAFTVGPVIGFSGVVFAFAGFALVRYPMTTVVALSASNLLDLVRRALLSPTVVASGRPAYLTPWWADIAIQGHALGLLVGVLLGAEFLHRRDEPRPAAMRLFLGVLLFAVSQSLWAVYWYRGGGSFVLYRALGASLVALLALLVTVAVVASDRPLDERARGLLRRLRDRSDSGDREAGAGDAAVADGSGRRGDDDEAPASLSALSMRQVGLVALVLGAAMLAGPAIPVNLVTTDGDLPGQPVSVRDYDVTYAEGVENGMVSAIDVSLFGETTQVETAGVIVTNPDRQVWTTAVSKGRLAFTGRQVVVLGGIGWRETVVAKRSGWSAVGGGVAYRVTISHEGETRTAFTSKPATAAPRIAGNNVSVAVTDERFYVVVAGGDETRRAPLPATNESVVLGNVTLTRTGDAVVAVHGDTRVTVLTKETYN